MHVSSKTILITGASRGIGLLAAKSLASSGHQVFASMRDMDGRNKSASDNLTAWARAKGVSLTPIEIDVTDDQSVESAVNLIEEQQPLDVLINNAGIMPTGLTEAYTLHQARECFDINMFGVMRTTRTVLPGMRTRRSGLLIHLSSAAGRLAIPFFGVYCASKWALEGYAESLHYELEDFNIASVLVEPSGHGTDLVDTAPAPDDGDRVAQYGSLAGGRDRLLGMFRDMFSQGDAITNAQNVADRIVEIVEMDGPRPIRTQVGADMGVTAVNTCTVPIQAQLIEGLKPVYTDGGAQ